MRLGRTFFLTGLSVGLAAVVAFCLILLVSEQAPSGTPIASTVLVLQASTLCAGDANLDGLRDVRDIVLVQAHILKQKTLGAQALNNADVNQDAQVDVRDIVELLLHRLGRSELESCEPVAPSEAPTIRFIAPGKGPVGTRFTLVGKDFSPVASENGVLFSRPGVGLLAEVTSVTENSLVGVVPEGLDFKLYRVSVGILGAESNGVGFEVSRSLPRLELIPSSTTVLMPPGSGKETLVIGGGTPPYKLKPLTEEDAQTVQAGLKGTVIDVTGVRNGSLTLEVEDSAGTPDVAESDVTVRDPVFQRGFQLLPHTLLAGSAPVFTLLINNRGGNLRILKTEIRLEGVEADFSRLQENAVFALGQHVVLGRPQNFQGFAVSQVESSQKVSFEARVLVDGSSVVQGRGTLEVEAGSTLFTLEPVPQPDPETLVRFSFDEQITLDHQIFRLPAAADADFEVMATFTSVSVLEGQELPLTYVRTLTHLRTVGLAEGAPRIESLVPTMGSVALLVRIEGAGFDPEPENNTVTFQSSGGERVEAAVESASEAELAVRVPLEAATGPVQVTVDEVVSNDYQFLVLFRPEAAIFFTEFPAGQPVKPILFLKQEPIDRFLGVGQDVGLASLKATLDLGQIKTDTLEQGQTAGTASLVSNSSGRESPLLLVYGGREEEEAQRHFFDFKRTLEDGSQGMLFLSESGEGEITFELIPRFSVLGSSLTIVFEEAVYVPPPESGITVNSSVEVRSVRWNFFPDAEMVMIFPGEVVTE